MSEAESKQRLLETLPHLRLAIEMGKHAEPEGSILMAVISKKADGSGTLICSFEGEQFLTDIAEVLGVADKPGWQPEEVEPETEVKP